MVEPPFESAQVNRALLQIYEGMTVYDQMHHKIGTVEYVYPGEAMEADEGFGHGEFASATADSSEISLIEDFARAIVLTEHVPETMRERLLCHGFIRIKSNGFFTPDCYAMPVQIGSVAGDSVMLCVSRDKLIRA